MKLTIRHEHIHISRTYNYAYFRYFAGGFNPAIYSQETNLFLRMSKWYVS